MKRIALKTILVLLTTIAALFAILPFAINLNSLHQFALSRVNSLIPGQISFEKMEISLFDLRVEIHNLSLSDSLGKKLVAFDRLLVDVSTLGLLKKALIVEDAILEQPFVELEIDSTGKLLILDAIATNQGEPKDSVDSQPDTLSKPFPVEVKNLSIVGGKALFAARMDSLDVKVHGLSILANGNTGANTVNLSFNVDSADVELAGRAIHLSELTVSTGIRNKNVDTVGVYLRTNNSVFNLNGRISLPLDSSSVDLQMGAKLSLTEIGSFLGLKDGASGIADITMLLDGRVNNPNLNLTMSYNGGIVAGYPVDSLYFRAKMADRALVLHPVQLKTGTGHCEIFGKIDAQGMFPKGFLESPGSTNDLAYDVEISGKAISLQKLAPNVSGTAGVSIKAKGKGVYPDSCALAFNMKVVAEDLKIDASPEADVVLACSADVKKGDAQIHDFSGKMGTTEINLNGKYNIFTTNIDALLNVTVPEMGTLLQFAGVDSITGSAALKTQIGGNLKNPQADIDMVVNNLAVATIKVDTIKLYAGLDKNGVAQVEELAIKHKNSVLMLNGSANVIDNGKPLPTDSMSFDVSIFSPGVYVNDFFDSLSGSIRLDANVKGQIDNLYGHIKLDAADINAAGQQISAVVMESRVEKQKLYIQDFTIEIAPGDTIVATGWASMKDSFDLALSVPSIKFSSIGALRAVDSLNGVISLNLNAGGVYKNPDVIGTLNVRDIQFGSIDTDPIALKINLNNNRISLDGVILGRLNAEYDLTKKSFATNLVIDDLSLSPYLVLADSNLTGILSASVAVTGNSDSLAAVNGELNILKLALQYKDIPVFETHELNVAFENKNYTVSDFTFSFVEKSQLKGNARGGFEGPHNATLNGTIPLQVAGQFVSELDDIEGEIGVDLSFNGTVEKPVLKAILNLKNIGVTIPGLSQRMHSLNGQIIADQNEVKISSMQGNIDNGTFAVKSKISLNKLAPSDLQTEITLKSLPLSVPDMLDLVIDAKLRIDGNPDTTLVAGDIVLLEGLYYQDLVLNPLAGMRQRKPKQVSSSSDNTTPYLKNMRFDVGVKNRNPFTVENNVAQMTIEPDLHLMGTIAAPTLNGRANVKNGTISYLTKTFKVERGIIDFVNPYAIEPDIDIIGSLQVKERMVQIAISGSPEDLVFKLTCDDPSLEDQDILSLLVLGKTTAELQNNLQLVGGEGESIQQRLASLISSSFGENIKKSTGLDMLEVETGNENTENSDRIALTVGKKLTKRLGTKYKIESENGEIVQKAIAEYMIVPNLFISGSQDTRGVYGGEVRFTLERR